MKFSLFVISACSIGGALAFQGPQKSLLKQLRNPKKLNSGRVLKEVVDQPHGWEFENDAEKQEATNLYT